VFKITAMKKSLNQKTTQKKQLKTTEPPSMRTALSGGKMKKAFGGTARKAWKTGRFGKNNLTV